MKELGAWQRVGLLPRVWLGVFLYGLTLAALVWLVLSMVEGGLEQSLLIGLFTVLCSGGIGLWLFRFFLPLDDLLAQLSHEQLPHKISESRMRGIPELHRLAVYLNHHLGLIHRARTTIEDELQRLKQATIQVRATFRKQLTTLPRQASSVHETVVTIEELTQSAASIAESTQRVSDTAQRAQDEHVRGIRETREMVRLLHSVRDGYDARWTAIQALLRKFEDIRDIIRYVHGMNDQTRLVAFNAAIEAASAGELSKRFNIVATDIRRLATDIDRSGDAIFATLDEMDQSLQSLSEAAEVEKGYLDKSARQMDQILSLLEKSTDDSAATTESARQIALTTQQQQSATRQVSQAARNISLSIDEFFASAQSTAKVIDEVEQLLEKMKKKLI